MDYDDYWNEDMEPDPPYVEVGVFLLGLMLAMFAAVALTSGGC